MNSLCVDMYHSHVCCVREWSCRGLARTAQHRAGSYWTGAWGPGWGGRLWGPGRGCLACAVKALGKGSSGVPGLP